MTTLRIKIKIGENEFEADGPPDTVEAQVRTFVRLIGREEKTETKPAEIPLSITKVARVNGKVVSLSVPCQSLEQAVMAVLLGQRQLRGNPFVAGTEIMAGLRDNILKRQAMLGNVVVTGKRRLKRYRLTTDGAERAQKIAQALAASAQQASRPQDINPPPSAQGD
jgi:hypothetical protein